MLTNILQRRGAGYWAAILGVALVTAIFAPFQATLNTTTVALAYLLVVLFVATGWGSWPASVASVLGTLCFNFFFLPPIYTLTIEDPQNWVALAAFLITAITAGQLSERAKQRAAAAEAARAVSAYNRSLIEASLDPLVTIGADSRIIDVNSATEAVTGRPRGELIGADFSRCFTEPERAQAELQQAWRAGFVRDHALQLRHRDGHSTSVLYNASVYRDDRGEPIGMVVAARAIRTSAQHRLRALADPDVVTFVGRFVSFASFVSVVVGLLGLAGWLFGIPVLKSVIPGQVVIKPNAAVCLVLIGLSLWLLRKVDDPPVPRARKFGGQVLAAFVAAVGLLSLTEYATRSGSGHRPVAVPGNRRGRDWQPASRPAGADHLPRFSPPGACAARAGLDGRVAIASVFARPGPWRYRGNRRLSSASWTSSSSPPSPTRTSRCRRQSSCACYLSAWPARAPSGASPL